MLYGVVRAMDLVLVLMIMVSTIQSDFQRGYSQLESAYLWDKYEDKRSSHLYGQESPNLTECEIFELQFS
ncbi:unnamed protein product [Paramecium octaurelia]|uniref:Uncharacterized protein n=1 Tax=Paramecium octaurelia TaxID=43137 RepID=A0A8S1YP36_PAROT|nr:unnamed protein product [Paramecium octaurelia]